MGEQEEDMDNIRVVLASASPRREELLRQIGIIPEVIPSEIEEKVTEKEPDRVVTELSREIKKEALQWKPGWTYTRCRKRKSKATLPAKSRTIRREHMEYRAGLPHISEALTVPTQM